MVHEAEIGIKDIRHRRVSNYGNCFEIEEYPKGPKIDDIEEYLTVTPLTSSVLDQVPPQVKRLNKLLEVFCLGCNTNNSGLYAKFVSCLFASCFIALLFLTNELRRLDYITPTFQIAVFFVSSVSVSEWRHCRTHLLFENLVCRPGTRTRILLQQSGRTDLAARVDEECSSFNKKFFWGLFRVAVVTTGSSLYINAGSLSVLFNVLFFAVSGVPSSVFSNSWKAVCRLHTLQIEAFTGLLKIAFHDLVACTAEEEEKQIRQSIRSIKISQRYPGVSVGDSTAESAANSTASCKAAESDADSTADAKAEAGLKGANRFFDEAFVMDCTVAFVDICKTMNRTTELMQSGIKRSVLLFLLSLAAVGISMLLESLNWEMILISLALVYFLISRLLPAAKTNRSLFSARRLSWDCYSEVINHTLLFKDSNEVNKREYQQILNTCKHMLMLVQTSREGIKIGQVEYSFEIIQKLLSVVVSAAFVIIRTGNKEQLIFWGK